MLRRLLSAKTEEEKQAVNKLSAYVKYMHKNFEIDPRRWMDLKHRMESEAPKDQYG